MNRIAKIFGILMGVAVLAITTQLSRIHADETAILPEDTATDTMDSSNKELMEAKDAMNGLSGNDSEEPVVEPVAPKKTSRKGRSAEAFVAEPDWEFDGFVAGGQDQHIKSMFAVNDLVYFNIGSGQGLTAGNEVGIYRRGDQIRDPQTHKSIGFEVRKIATAEVSNRVSATTCSARILKSYEAVEIGDMVRRAD